MSNRLANEVGVQRAKSVKAAQARVDALPDSVIHLDGTYTKEGWTDEQVAELVKEVTRKG